MTASKQDPKSGAGDKAPTAATRKSAEEVIATYSTPVQDLARQVVKLVKHAVPGAVVTVKWGNPVFESGGRKLCYLQGHKDYLRFGFFEQALDLDDREGLLEGTGKAMRHVKLRDESDIRPILEEWLKQVAAMNSAATSGREER
jgi:hypothetical protein